MASSPPESPLGPSPRPLSAIVRPSRSSSGLSLSSKQGGGSRASDDDGRTSVKVAIRVRPPLRPADPGFDLIPQRFQRSIAHVTSPTSLAVDSPQGRKLFVFDRVFAQDVRQDGVWDYLNESVNAFVQGYNVSILAYGQSGSGKSYTMGTSGPLEQSDPKVMGVIPRAAAALFEKLGAGQLQKRDSLSALRTPKRFSMSPPAASRGQDKEWIMKATYVEIYNEQLRDLLLPESVPQHERSGVIIREDVKGRILLTGLHQVSITSVDDLLAALNFGSSIRQTDATAINAKSSRSHAVFSLNLIQRRTRTPAPQDKRMSVPAEALAGGDGWVTVDSKLHFVDLAGSERLKNTGAQGERAREGISINAGLASLGKVISQLSSRQAGSHVSYRDSKLTRLLQDSLGGNAITYMIACVTPAEFHLSETLNTVQYAQRARAIQSKPQIQQIADDGDKQALIDRLRAEIAFLRDQIRSSERNERRITAPQERAERHHEREAELQNQLLDVQENYSALSQRHARLISEIAKSQDMEHLQSTDGAGSLTDSALERLKRSNSFAEAVEQVVLEYEKTIQSLETSLSNTRSSLSATESNLLEKESRCAYVETINQQLQARVQKMMDREIGTEHYLHELESKLDGHTSGEEKNTAMVVELRKEISRARENEASCEDYISTLEERLAEADQDSELMQREIDRLEHVIERQRGLGKLDHLLNDLDGVQRGAKGSGPGRSLANGEATRALESLAEHETSETSNLLNGSHGSDGAEQTGERAPAVGPRNDSVTESSEGEGPEASDSKAPVKDDGEYPSQSSAQSKFVAEKLDTVTQELIDLRMDHETTLNEFDMLSAKYEEALRTLSQLQDAVDEARHPASRDAFATPASTRPSSFLGDARVNESKVGAHLSSSRSLSSELFSAGESPSTSESSDTDTPSKKVDLEDRTAPSRDQQLVQEVEHLKRMQQEKDQSMHVLAQEYAKLQEQHHEMLDEVEELKTEISKARAKSPTSPSGVIRRKSSHNVMMVDRAHRSFASLRNIAAENLEDKPDVMQGFELNLNAAMHELHARSERVQELEADIAAVKKEMEAKMAIISGLTRERCSLKNSSPMDISVVSTMRDQLLQSENKVRMLQETQAVREQALLAEIEELRVSLEAIKAPVRSSAGTADDDSSKIELQEQKITELQEELGNWERKHASSVESMQTSERKLLDTMKEMRENMVKTEEQEVAKPHNQEHQALADDLHAERAHHREVVDSLQRKIDEYASSITAYTGRMAELEQAHMDVLQDLAQSATAGEALDLELASHRDLVSDLEQRVSEHQSAIREHEARFASLQEAHALQMETLQKEVQDEAEERFAQQAAEDEEIIRSLQAEVTEAKDEMERLLQGLAIILNEEVSVSKLQSHVQALAQGRSDAESRYLQAKETVEKIDAENADLRRTVSELTRLCDDSTKEIERLNEQYQKSSRIVEELEEQLSTNFDQHQLAHNRLSILESERNHRFEEVLASRNQAVSELETVREELARLEAKLSQPQPNGVRDDGRQRSDSLTNNLRKSASVVSLPSPPPAIPLPPLPSSAASGNLAGQSPPTPTTSRHMSKELGNSPYLDDREARMRTMENNLFAEKQLTSALEEALADLENQDKQVKEDLELWKKKAWAYEDEIEALRNNQKKARFSMQAVEEERNARKQAEAARAQLEERMNALNKKKKKSSLNCF